MAQQLYFSRDTRLFIQFRNTTDQTNDVAGAGAVWEVPILDGYSFSQSTNTSEITLAEMESTAGISRRGRRMFTDSLAPAEWSFSTYVRPFDSKAGSAPTGIKAADSAAEVHAVEEALWASMFGADTYSAANGFTRATNAVSGPVITPAATETTILTTESNRSALHAITIYFVMDTAAGNPLVYKLPEAVVNEASIDFDVDGIALINWSGFAKEIIDFSGSVLVGTDFTPDDGVTTVDGTTIAAGDLIFDTDNANGSALYLAGASDGTDMTSTQAIDEAIRSTKNFIRNRISQVSIDATNTTIFPGTGGNGEYSLVLTGGNFTISNNITYLVPEELGAVNKPLEHVTGTRTVTGSATCYLTLDDASLGTAGTSRQFFNDLVSTQAMSQTVNEFSVVMKVGGANATGTPALNITMPKCHFEVPSHSIEDVISLETSFHALPSDFGSANEITNLKYTAPAVY